jgi:hypothetical protein
MLVPTVAPTNSTIFLHELACGSIKRIVQVGINAQSGGDRHLGFDCNVINPGTLFSDPNVARVATLASFPDGARAIDVLDPRRQTYRVYAGQTDPADPSRFTMRYDIDGLPGMLEGRLRPDGLLDFTVLTLRNARSP